MVLITSQPNVSAYNRKTLMNFLSIMWSSCKRTTCRPDSVQAAWSGSPLEAAQAVEVDTGLGSGGGIDEGTGWGTVVGWGDTRGAVWQNTEEVEERGDKMDVGDTAD